MRRPLLTFWLPVAYSAATAVLSLFVLCVVVWSEFAALPLAQNGFISGHIFKCGYLYLGAWTCALFASPFALALGAFAGLKYKARAGDAYRRLPLVATVLSQGALVVFLVAIHF